MDVFVSFWKVGRNFKKCRVALRIGDGERVLAKDEERWLKGIDFWKEEYELAKRKKALSLKQDDGDGGDIKMVDEIDESAGEFQRHPSDNLGESDSDDETYTPASAEFDDDDSSDSESDCDSEGPNVDIARELEDYDSNSDKVREYVEPIGLYQAVRVFERSLLLGHGQTSMVESIDTLWRTTAFREDTILPESIANSKSHLQYHKLLRGVRVLIFHNIETIE